MTEPVYDQQDADNYHLATENRNLKKRIEELEQQIAALRAENEQLIARYNAVEKWRQQTSVLHLTSEQKRKNLEAQLTALQAENEKLQQRNDNQYTIISDFSSQLRALQEKL